MSGSVHAVKGEDHAVPRAGWRGDTFPVPRPESPVTPAHGTVAGMTLVGDALLDYPEGWEHVPRGRQMPDVPSESPDDRGGPSASRADTAAYERAIRSDLPRLLATATRILKDPSEALDAVQDGCLQGYRALDGFDGRADIGTWLHRIVINAALSRLRRANQQAEEQIDELMPEYDLHGVLLIEARTLQVSAETMLLRTETRLRVRDAIDRLPDAYRVVLVLRDLEELSTRETADALGCTEGVVKTRLHRARLALKTLLRPFMEPDE